MCTQMLYRQMSGCVLVQLGHVTTRMTHMRVPVNPKWLPKVKIPVLQVYYHKYAQLLLENAISVSNRVF